MYACTCSSCEAGIGETCRRLIAKLQRYSGAGAPLRQIVGIGQPGMLGRWVKLDCGHWREITHYDILPAMNRKRPTAARCGLCREGITVADCEHRE